jgi:hypothetical protein
VAKKSVKGDENNTVKADSFFAAQLQQNVLDNGRDDRYLATEGSKIIIGIPLKAISLRYLFVNSVFPLTRMTQLIGQSESCKTAFLFELYRWHIYNTSDHIPYSDKDLHGGYVHNVCEPRDSPDLRESILKVPRSVRYPSTMCDHIESWQWECSNWIKHAASTFEPGAMPYPMALGVDSLTAVTTKDEMDTTWEQGFAQPGYAQIAKNLNMWFKVFCNKIRIWPASFIGINHMKVSKDNRGFNVVKIPGGDALRFAATFLLQFKMVDRIEKLNEFGRELEISTVKNSLSPAGENRTLKNVRMMWTIDDANRQHTHWDWHGATVSLLSGFEATRKKRIMDIVSIESIDKTRRTADCRQLGLTKASWTEIGQAISDNKDMVQALDKLFGVRERLPFILGKPYNEQVMEALANYKGEDESSFDASAAEFNIQE